MGTTLTRGGAAVTTSGTVVLLGFQALLVGSSVAQLPPTQQFPRSPAQASPLVGQASLHLLHPCQLSPSGLVISSNTSRLLDVFTVCSHVFTAYPAGLAMDGTPVSPGGPGTTVAVGSTSLGPSNSVHRF